jgi:hypothetical protein
VLTLLQSQYTIEDEIDLKLIKAAIELDILAWQNSILWRPNEIDGYCQEGKFTLRFYDLC